jgi:outer membrane protein assembly factor BamB
VIEDNLIYLESSKDTIGQLCNSKQALVAIGYHMYHAIYHSSFSLENKLLYLELRDISVNDLYRHKGKVLIFDIKYGAARWVRKTDFRRSHNIFNKDNILKLRTLDAYNFDPDSGYIKWHLNKKIILTDFEHNIGFYSRANKLFAFSLSNKKKIWSKRMKIGNNIRIFPLNKNNLLLYSAGAFYVLNANNGEEIRKITQKMHFPKTKEKFFKFTSLDNLLPQQNSDYYVKEKNKFYFANADGLHCISDDGYKIWSSPFQERKLGASFHIWQNNEYVGIVNYYDKRNSNKEAPFVGIYDKQSGKTIFFISFDSKQKLIDVRSGHKQLSLLFEDHIKIYSFDKNETQSINLTSYKENKPKSFYPNKIYPDGKEFSWQALPDKETNNSIMYEDGRLVILGQQLPARTPSPQYSPMEITNNEHWHVIWDKDHFHLLNQNFKSIARIDKFAIPALYNDTLFLMENKNLYFIDLHYYK